MTYAMLRLRGALRRATGTRAPRTRARATRPAPRAAPAAALAAALAFASATAGAAPGASPTSAEPAPAPATSVRLIGADHPLAGRVWSVREGRFVAPADVEAAVAAAAFVLLGERHGNPEHHRLQARLIAAAARDGRPLAVVAEQLDFPQQPSIDACARDCGDFGAELGARVAWEKSGWPDYALYAPVFAAAAAAGARVEAGNPGAARVRALTRGEAPTDAERAWVEAARTPLAAEGRERLVEDLVKGHCGHLPAARTEPLVLAQRLRDAAMAATMAATLATARAQRDAAVLVAGTGHVRRDYGVPTLLDEPRTVVVAFVETVPGRERPADYLPPGAYDYAWFTARVDEPDPCEQFREQLRKLAPSPAPARP